MSDLLHTSRETTATDEQSTAGERRLRPRRPTRLALFLAAVVTAAVAALGVAIDGGSDPARPSESTPAPFVSIAPSDPAGVSGADG